MNTSNYREFASNESPRQHKPPEVPAGGNGGATTRPPGQPTGQSSSGPDLPDGDEHRAQNLAGWIESLADYARQAVPLAIGWERRHQDLLLAQRELGAATLRLEEQLSKTNLRLARMELAADSSAKEITRLALVASSLSGRYESISYNLDQIRTMAEASARKQQELVDDFIERHVTDHLFKEFLKLQLALTRLCCNGTTDFKTELGAIAQAIESFLEESGLHIIHPLAGAEIEPREHLPVKVLFTNDQRLDGKIAETFDPGLGREQRILQPARVAVFRAEDS